jgi:DNA-binding transcriptional ArsR family regulator
MLSALLDGRALTATELAYAARVTPQTASTHLAKLTEAGLIAPVRDGRYRYFHPAISDDRLIGFALRRAVGLAPGSQPSL